MGRTAGLLATVALCGCGGGSGSASSRLAGIWVQDSIAIPNASSADCSATSTTRALTSRQDVQYACAGGKESAAIFNADGTYIGVLTAQTGDNVQQQGTWQLNGGTLHITITSPAASAGSTVGTIKFQDVPTTSVGGLSGQSSAAGGTIGTGTGASVPKHTFVFTYTSGPYTGFSSTYEASTVQ